MPSSVSFLLVLLTLLWEGSPPNKHLWSSSKILCKSRRCALSSWHCQSVSVSLAAPPGRNDRLQTAATPWKDHCMRAFVCVRRLGHARNAHCSLEFSTDSLNPSEPKVGTAHTWTHTGRRSPFPAPHSSMLDTGCTQQTHGTAHACVCHVLLKPHVLTFSMPSCHFGRMRNSIVFHSRFGGKREKGDSTESRCHKSTFVLHLCICCH